MSVLNAFRYACCVHAVPLRTNTYAAPLLLLVLSLWFPFTLFALLSSWNAPTTTVSPEIATEWPKLSPAPVFDAFRYACCAIGSMVTGYRALRSSTVRTIWPSWTVIVAGMVLWSASQAVRPV